MTIKILLITANIGNYDTPFYDVPEELSGVQLLRICDSGDKEDFHRINKNTFLLSLQKQSLISSRLISRIPKINPLFLFDAGFNPPSFFPASTELLNTVRCTLGEFDYLIWMDGNCKINSYSELVSICLNVSPNGWGIYSHPDRSCIFKEARCVKGFDYVNLDVLSAQMHHYRMQHVPRNYGLYSCNFIIRSRVSLLQAQDLWNLWLNEFLRWVPRDQLSLPYCLFTYPHHIPTILGKFTWANSVFSFSPHASRK